MASRRKEDDKHEKIIRSLMKLPENRRCINCNSLGPQYVCSNFSIFVCTTCSGVHREFTHRIKSVSMATFTAEEVRNLQEGGNERAREYFLRDWDFSRQMLPDSSNPEKLRDFIKAVYVDRRYCAGGRGGGGGGGGSRSGRSDDDASLNRRDSRERDFADEKYGSGRSDGGRFDDRRGDSRRGSGSGDFGRSDTKDGSRAGDGRFDRRHDERRDGGSWGEDRRDGARYDDRRSGDWGSRGYDDRDKDRRPDDRGRYDDRDRERDRKYEDDRRDRRPGYRDYPESPPVKHISTVLGENAPPLRVSIDYDGRSNGRYEDDTPGMSPSQRNATRAGSVSGTEDSSRPGSAGGHKRSNSVPLIDFNLDGEPAATSTQQASEDGGLFGANSVASSSATAGWATFDVTPPQGGTGVGGGEFDSFSGDLFAGSGSGAGTAVGGVTAVAGGTVSQDGSSAWGGTWGSEGMNSANVMSSGNATSHGHTDWASFDASESPSQVQTAQTPVQPQAPQWDTFGVADNTLELSASQQLQQPQHQQPLTQHQQQFQQVLQAQQTQQVQQQGQGVNLQRSLSSSSATSPTKPVQTSSRPALPDEFFTDAYTPMPAAFYGMPQGGRLTPGAQYVAVPGGMMGPFGGAPVKKNNPFDLAGDKSSPTGQAPSFPNMGALQAALPQLRQAGPYSVGGSMGAFVGPQGTWANQSVIRGPQSFPPTGMMMGPGTVPQFAMGPGAVPGQGSPVAQMLMSPTMVMPGQGMGMLPPNAAYMPGGGVQMVGGGQFPSGGMQRVPYMTRPSGAGNPFG